MSTTGVIINGTDTLLTWGLILLDDLTISGPEVKEAYVDLPGADGSLDYADALVGYPVFEDRTVTFKLFKPMTEAQRATVRTDLLTAFGGRKVTLITPDLPGFYWEGRMSIGEVSGYNAGVIPCSVRVKPYRLKNTITTVTESLPANTDVQVDLDSSGMPTLPTFRCTRACTLTDSDGNTYSLTQNTDYTSADLMITGSGMTVTARVSQNGTLTVTYQEGTL